MSRLSQTLDSAASSVRFSWARSHHNGIYITAEHLCQVREWFTSPSCISLWFSIRVFSPSCRMARSKDTRVLWKVVIIQEDFGKGLVVGVPFGKPAGRSFRRLASSIPSTVCVRSDKSKSASGSAFKPLHLLIHRLSVARNHMPTPALSQQYLILPALWSVKAFTTLSRHQL